MYIYEKYDYSLFESRFRDYKRLDNFPKGLRDLFNYLEGLAESTDNPINLDVIAVCCEFSEINIEDIERETGCEDLDDLKNNTTVIEVEEETIIYTTF